MAKVGGATVGETKPKTATDKVKDDARKVKNRAVNADALKAQGGEIFEKLTEEQKNEIGSKSADIALLYPLYSETELQTGKVVGACKVLGGRFKNVGKEPITFLLGEIVGRENGGLIEMEFGEKTTKEVVKPGDEIALTNGEIFVNLFQPQFAREALGGKVFARFRVSHSKKPKKVPGITWALGRGIGMAKEDPIPTVNDIYKPFAVKVGADAEGKGGKGEIVKGYERFAPYLAKKKRTSTGGNTGGGSKETYEFLAMQNDIAALIGK